MERYNLVVIGAGSGGLVVAAGGSGLGARVALVEKHTLPFTPEGGTPVRAMGGDCLQYGCVPSKALLRAGKAAHAAREAGRFAIRGASDPGPQDLGAVMDYVHGAQARIAPADSVERFEGLGVDVLLGTGTLKSAHEVEVNGTTVWGHHVVVATGSRANIPPIPGLEETGYLTNESVWHARTLPGSFLVMGGGPVGTEIGQAFARLGSKVTIVSSSPHICPKEDADIAAVLVKQLKSDDVTIHDDASATKVAKRDGRKVVTVKPKSGGARGRSRRDPRGDGTPPEHRGPQPRGRGGEVFEARHRDRRQVPHERAVRLGDRRRRGPVSLHALGGLSGRHRPKEHAVAGRPRLLRRLEHALDHVHRPRDLARGPRRRGGEAEGHSPSRLPRRVRTQRPGDLRRNVRRQLPQGARRPDGPAPRRLDRASARRRSPRRDRPREEEWLSLIH